MPVPTRQDDRADGVTERVRMVDDLLVIGERRMRYSISDNVDAKGWALNIHGFFAGGGVYWRESTRIAAKLGLRVVNPNMPAFAGSDALHWDDLTMQNFAATLAQLMDHIGIDKALLLGHSMGGAVAVQFAHDHPDRTLGLIYRDGVATASWTQRRGLLKRLIDPVSPDIADAADIAFSTLLDFPDWLFSRLSSMLSTLTPDVRQNARNLLDTAPVAAMLLYTDLTPLVEALGASDLPILPMWGRFDRLVPAWTAEEFSRITGRTMHWVWGGHSWMIPRPATTIDTLTGDDVGQAFLKAIGDRSGLEFPTELAG